MGYHPNNIRFNNCIFFMVFMVVLCFIYKLVDLNKKVMSTETTLRVGDIVKNFSEKDKKNTELILDKLSVLGREYANMEDTATPERLEEIKRELGSYLTSLSTYLAKVKCYKFNNDYLEEERKQIKSEAVNMLVDNKGLSQSAAEKVVYAEDYYKQRVELLQQLKKFFWNVELKYDRYKDVLRSVYQSVSILTEEKRRS